MKQKIEEFLLGSYAKWTFLFFGVGIIISYEDSWQWIFGALSLFIYQVLNDLKFRKKLK